MGFVYVMLVLLAAALIQNRIYKKLAFRDLQYTCRFDTYEATEGDKISLVETVSNKKLLPLPWLRSELTTSRYLEYADSQSTVTDDTRFVSSFFTMKSYSRTTRSWDVRCVKRGVFDISKCMLLSTDLLGMSSVSQPVQVQAELMVLPRPVALETALESANRLSGDVIVRRHYIPDPFYIAGVREYTQRDSLNKIHWPATAKAGRLMVHNNEYTVNQNLLVILNMQSRSYEVDGKVTDREHIEYAIKVCAGYFDSTVETGIPLRFAVNADMEERNGETLVSNEFSGAEHVRDLMRTLARLPMKFSLPLPHFLDNVCMGLQASDIVLVTAYLSEKIFNFAREKQAKGVRVKIVCVANNLSGDVPDDLEIYLAVREEGENP